MALKMAVLFLFNSTTGLSSPLRSSSPARQKHLHHSCYTPSVCPSGPWQLGCHGCRPCGESCLGGLCHLSHSPGVTLWSSSSLSMTSFWTPGVPCVHEIVQADAGHHNLLCMLWPLGKTRQQALESVHQLPEGISTTRLAREQR